MDSFRTSPPHSRSTRLNMQFPLSVRSRRRDLPTAPSARAPGLQYRFSYTDLAVSASLEDLGDDPMVVIEALYDYHQRRQAMLSALALLRGDDATEQLW